LNAPIINNATDFESSPSLALFFRKTRKWAGVDSNDEPEKLSQPVTSHTDRVHTTGPAKSQEVQNMGHIVGKHPELAELIARWPGLPDEVKKQILKLATQRPSLMDEPLNP